MSYELYHHGILGMKWGIRRFQNPDGSLTLAGKKRYKNGNSTVPNSKSNQSSGEKKKKSMTDDQRKKEIKRLSNELWSKSSWKDSVLYSRNTYKLAARYMVNNRYGEKRALDTAKDASDIKRGLMFAATLWGISYGIIRRAKQYGAMK